MTDLYWLISGLLQPFTVLMLLLGVCVFWPQPCTAPRRRRLKICYVLAYLYCTPLVASFPIWWLETRFPRVWHRPEGVDVIVVLGGGAVVADPADEPAHLIENSWTRCQTAARLYHDGPPCPVLASGGMLFEHVQMPPLSQLLAATLQDFRVAPDDLVQEDRSRTTSENAEFSAEIIRQRGWKRVVLVTNALHLWRSERFFRKEGVEVIPVGCLYRSDEFSWDVFTFLPRSRAIERHEEAMHELIGGLYAFLRGTW